MVRVLRRMAVCGQELPAITALSLATMLAVLTHRTNVARLPQLCQSTVLSTTVKIVLALKVVRGRDRSAIMLWYLATLPDVPTLPLNAQVAPRILSAALVAVVRKELA